MEEVESMATQGKISRPGAWSFPDALELGTRHLRQPAPEGLGLLQRVLRGRGLDELLAPDQLAEAVAGGRLFLDGVRLPR